MRGISAIRQQDPRSCTESRSEENGCWAGGVPTKTPLRESGSRSSPGSRPIPNAAAATFSGSCSAALPDAINHCKSAPYSAACGKYEPTCLKPLKSNGKMKSSMVDHPRQSHQQRGLSEVPNLQLNTPPGKNLGSPADLVNWKLQRYSAGLGKSL